MNAPANIHPCPACGAPLIRRASQRRPSEYFWVCSGELHHLYTDRDGQLGPSLDEIKKGLDSLPQAECPACSKRAVRRASQRHPGAFFWVCEDGHFHADADGQPGSPLPPAN